MTVNCKICGKQFDSFRGLNGHMNAHLKRRTFHSEEIDDEDYWEPYLEALEILWWHCVEYVDYASETYCGIVECMTLWTNVAEHSSAHDVGYIVNKVHKFKLEAIRYIWDDDPNYVWEKLEFETRELLENFNPEGRDYEGSHIPTMYSGWPSLNDIKEDFNPRWLPERGTAYAFDLYDAEEYTKRTGSRVTKGRKQRWIPVAIEYIRTHGKSTAAEIHPSLPDHRSAATPIHAMALSNRLIRMPDIFIVDKSSRPYTYSLVETKEAESFEAPIPHFPRKLFGVEVYRKSKVRSLLTHKDMGGILWKSRSQESPGWRLRVDSEDINIGVDSFDQGVLLFKKITEGPSGKYWGAEQSFNALEDDERRKFGVEAYDEKITVWICNACNRRFEDQNDAEDCCEGVEEVPYFDGKSKELREVHLHEAESSDYDGDVKMYYELEIDDRHGNFAQISGSFVYDSRVWDFESYAELEYDETGPCLLDIYWEDAEIIPSESYTLADFKGDIAGYGWKPTNPNEIEGDWKYELPWGWESGPPQELLDKTVGFMAEFEAEYCTTCKIPNHDSCSLTEGCPCCDNVMAGIYTKRFGADTSLSELTVHVEVPDKRTTKSITFEMPTHILKDHTLIHEAIENRLMDILQQPFGGWDLISTKELEAETFEDADLDFDALRTYPALKSLSDHELMELGIDCLALRTANQERYDAESFGSDTLEDCEEREEGWMQNTEELDDQLTWFVDNSSKSKIKEFNKYRGWSAESFEANYDPSQARDGKGRWTDTESNEVTIDLDSDELSALADAIRQQDETFPEVDMLLEQIGNTPENRELVFQEMLEVLSGFISEVMDKPQVESPENYYKYILEEPAEDEMGRLYRQANYYAQFKNSIEIEEALEELHFQFQMAKEMGAEKDIVASIEKDINFVELVSRVQDMQREYAVEDYAAESLAVEEIEDSDWVCEACEYEGGHDPTKTDYCPNCGECIECCGFDESITRGALSFGMCGLLGCDSCLTTSTDSAYMPYENFCAICDEQGDVDICEYCHTDADWEDPRYGIRGISYKPHEMKEHEFVPMKPPNIYDRKTGKSKYDSLKSAENEPTCEACGEEMEQWGGGDWACRDCDFIKCKECGDTRHIHDTAHERPMQYINQVKEICPDCLDEDFEADWNPTQPRVPTNCPKCKKEEPCPCPKPGPPGPPGPPSPPGKGGKGGTNPVWTPPIPSPDHDNNQWVNRQTGEIYRGKKPSGAQWRLVEMVPVVINGKQHYIANILDEIVKMWPPSSVIYRRNPPLIVIADKKINLKGLSIKGLKIDGNNITYE